MAFKYKDYEKSDEVQRLGKVASQSQNYVASGKVQQARENMYKNEGNKPAEWNGGTYGDALKGALDKIQNREKFSYDLNSDALYQQYKDKYINQGKLAMQDTLGQASALTGGYGNSYAATAGNQAYQSYLQKLNDIVPELYNAAYTRYRDEGNDLKDQYNILANQYGIEYGESRDKMSDWQNEQNRLTNLYYNEAEMDYDKFKDRRDTANDLYNKERSYDYGIYADAYNNALNAYKQGVAEDQYNRDLALNYAKLNQDQSQFDDNLALNYAKLLQDQNQFESELGLKQSQYDSDLAYKYASLYAKNNGNATGEDGDTGVSDLGEAPDLSGWTDNEWRQYLLAIAEQDGEAAALKVLREEYPGNALDYTAMKAHELAIKAAGAKKNSNGGNGTKSTTAQQMEAREALNEKTTGSSNDRTKTLSKTTAIDDTFKKQIKK